VTSRQLRRAAERQAAKQNRAEINRANSQHSTGPRTIQGKAASSQNAFKHGLYSKDLIVHGEDPAEFDALKADLRREHQPANTTEEILVNEMAEQFWRIRRYRVRESRLIMMEDPEEATMALLKFLPIIQRFMTAAERGFHKALTALRQLQKDRGFVPQSAETAQNTKEAEPAGSVPQNTGQYFEATACSASHDDTELRDLAGSSRPHLQN